MKCTVAKTVFLEGIQPVQHIVESRTTMQVLSNVLLKAENDRLWFHTTNLNISVSVSVDATVKEPGATTLHVRRLASVVKELSGDQIDMDVDASDMAKIKCGPSEFKIIGLPHSAFPDIPRPQADYTFSMPQKKLRGMLLLTSYAASTDETRQLLNGVFLTVEGDKVTAVATDGRRLALIEQMIESDQIKVASMSGRVDVILPSKTVNELIMTLGDEGIVTVFIEEKRVFFSFGATMISSKLIEGTFPNYRKVVPEAGDKRVVIEREALLLALRRVSLLNTDQSNPVYFTFACNTLELAMSAADIGEARETIPVRYDGEKLTVSYNAAFMMDPLRHLQCDEISLELSDMFSPGIVKCDMPFLYVIMPMRVN